MKGMKTKPILNDSLQATRASFLTEKLKAYSRLVREPDLPVQGRLKRKTGMTLVATGCSASIGGRCRIQSHSSQEIETEVVGFADDSLYLMPIGRHGGLTPGARVIPTKSHPEVFVGDELLGRVMDGSGVPRQP